MAKKATKKSNIKTSFTNTKGEKIVVTKSGEKFRNGISEGGIKNGYREVVGKKSGNTHLVKLGSKADAKYATSGGSDGGIGVISSNQGKDLVKEADEKMSRLAPEPISADPVTGAPMPGTPPAPTSATAPTATPAQPEKATKENADFATYYNETTGQETTLRGDALNETNKTALTEQGYKIASADTSTAPKNPDIERLESEIATSESSVNSFMSRLESSLITDKELRGDIRTIKQAYSARIEEAKQITERRKQALNTLGSRLGARYTGGTNGILGGIIAEEESQGLARITAIENSKQEAIRNAKTEARNYNYNAYTKLMAQADKLQEQKVAELTQLKKLQEAKDKEIAEEKKQAEYDALIAEQLSAGVTDPIKLFQNLGGKVPFDQIGEIIKLMPKAPEDFTLSEGQKRFDADGNVIASVAKTYAPKSIPSGMTSGQVSAFNSIVGKYNASPLIQASDRTVVLKNSIEEARNDPSNGAKQLNLVYSYVQALDTYQSAVREGELALVNSIDSKVGKLENFVTKIQNGQIVRPEVAKELATAAENLVNTIDEGAARKAKSFESQASTVGLGSQWNQYISGFTQSYNDNIEARFEGMSNAELLGLEEPGEEFIDPNNIYSTP